MQEEETPGDVQGDAARHAGGGLRRPIFFLYPFSHFLSFSTGLRVGARGMGSADLGVDKEEAAMTRAILLAMPVAGARRPGFSFTGIFSAFLVS